MRGKVYLSFEPAPCCAFVSLSMCVKSYTLRLVLDTRPTTPLCAMSTIRFSHEFHAGLLCPVCHGSPPRVEATRLSCESDGCGAIFPVVDGFPRDIKSTKPKRSHPNYKRCR